MTDLLTSAEVARLAGVGPTTVKRWADNGALPCVKTPGGHRRFERQALERLLHVPATSSSLSTRDWTGWMDAALYGGSLATLQAKLFALRSIEGSWHAAASVLGELFAEMGRRWESGTLSVIEEHVVSSALQRAIASVVESIPVAADAPRCLLACAEGDDHTLGLSLAELCLREAGWQSEWSGRETRASDVVDRVSAGGVGMVAVSASVFSSDAGRLAAGVRVVGEACKAAGVALALGGSGAWPERPRHGARFSDLGAFYEFAVTRARS